MNLSLCTLVTRRKQIHPVIQKQIILRTGFSSVLIDYPLLTVSFCFCLYSLKRLNVAFSILQSASEIIAAHLEVITHM